MTNRACGQCFGTSAQDDVVERKTGFTSAGGETIFEVVMIVFREPYVDHALAMAMSVYLCHRFKNCSLSEIAKYFGIDEGKVIECCKCFESNLYLNQRLAERVAGMLVETKV